MAESNAIQTLALVSSEVDESQTRITLASQCIKAQEDLANKLRKESLRRREICNFMKSDNLKLESEIKNAEIELKSLMLAHETIKSANVELKKELLLSKQNNVEMLERVHTGEKKYEDLWLECKKRFETIPYVQKWMQATNKCDTLKEATNILAKEANMLSTEFKNKRELILGEDRKQIVKLAEFFVNEVPAKIHNLKEKSAELVELNKEIEKLAKEQENDSNKFSVLNSYMSKLNIQPSEEKVQDENWPHLNKYDDTFMMPKLQLSNVELDVISHKLEQIKKVDSLHINPVKRIDSDTGLSINMIKRSKTEQKLNEDYISSYFNRPITLEDFDDKQYNLTDDYSKRKLINILEDIKLDPIETKNIISKVNPEKLQGVTVINSDAINIPKDSTKAKVKESTPLQSEEIEEIDLTTKSENILIPPTQFIDLTQEKVRSSQQEVDVIFHMSMEGSTPKNMLQLKSSQERKRVSFDLPTSVQDITDDIISADVEKPANNDESVANETLNSELDISAVTDDNFMRIKDMILKKHHLDLSPQFIYAKNTTMIQKNNDDKIITSKFFDQTINKCSETNQNNQKDEVERPIKATQQSQTADEPVVEQERSPKEDNMATMEVDDAVSSPKTNNPEKPVSGFLFSHGPHGIPETLDISLSTTGYEEGDDFPHCLDSSLLLSPKADLPMNMTGEAVDVGSQEVPNFLSGFRKTGLSFFGQKKSETNAETNAPNQNNNFNFNFGGDEKKSRGGLFSFFR